jgi:hypothetical protein
VESLRSPFKVLSLDEALPIPQLQPGDPRLNGGKKIDANDLLHALGPAGFLQWIQQQKPVCVHWNNSTRVPFGAIRRAFRTLRPYVIDGLLRRGEVMNIIAAPKVGKSLISLDLARAIISGGKFIGKFPCAKGRILIIDNELHAETIAYRVPQTAAALNIPIDRVDRLIEYDVLRGNPVDLYQLEQRLRDIHPRSVKAIILDAFYKFMPEDTQENSNADYTRLYNVVDKYAALTDAAIVLIHHTSKGVQFEKDVTDVGAGAGAQSRAADTHFVLRQHEDDGVVIVEAVTRSFKAPESFCARMKFPRWELAPDSDPTMYKGAAKEKEREEKRTNKQKQIEQDLQLKDQLVDKITTPMKPSEIEALGAGLGISRWNLNQARTFANQMVGLKRLIIIDKRGGSGGWKFIKAGLEPKQEITNVPEVPE